MTPNLDQLITVTLIRKVWAQLEPASSVTAYLQPGRHRPPIVTSTIFFNVFDLKISKYP
jgi:hypothetical protein